uniref:Uncharacterized protein n=1 Tax=Fopius arisanus TaxID=64838 RepID=A0A0C9QIZ7_9HYME
MLSYMLPNGDKPPPGETQSCSHSTRIQNRGDSQMTRNGISKTSPSTTTMITTTISTNRNDNDGSDRLGNDMNESPKHNGGTTARKSTLHTSRISKDDSLHSINSEASTGGSDRKSKIANGAKHASLKRVSFGSSKGSMVETLVYETPVQEEPEINHFSDHNGRLPMMPVPDTDEGREKVRVAFLGPQPHPSTPGVLLLDPVLPSLGYIDAMSTGPAELLTTHTEHTSPAYHAQIRI